MRTYSGGGVPGEKARRTALSTSGRPSAGAAERAHGAKRGRAAQERDHPGRRSAEREHVAAERDDGGHVVGRVERPGERDGGAERVADQERALEAQLGRGGAQHRGLGLGRVLAGPAGRPLKPEPGRSIATAV